MIRLRVCTMIALIAWSTSAGTAAQVGRSDPEDARLSAMVGTWNVELSFCFRPAGPAVTATGVSTIQSLFGGLFVEEKSSTGRRPRSFCWKLTRGRLDTERARPCANESG